MRERADASAASQSTDDEGTRAIRKGEAALLCGDFDAALNELTHAIRLRPSDATAFLLRGQVWDQQGEDEQALNDYSVAIQIDIQQLFAFAKRMVTLTSRRDFDAAVQDADESLKLHQRLCQNSLLRAGVYARRGDWPRAIADYHQILQLEPANTTALLRRGHAHAHGGDFAKAADDFTAVLAVLPSCLEALTSRAHVYEQMGQLDAAHADYSEALRIDGQHVPARLGRAELYLQRGDHDLAIADFNQVLLVQPSTAQAYRGRGQARLEKGDTERALADLQRALKAELGPTLPATAQSVIDRLHVIQGQIADQLKEFRQLFRRTSDMAIDVLPGPKPVPAGKPEARTLPSPRSPVREAPSAEDAATHRQRLFDEHFEMGRARKQAGEIEGAIAAYTEALKLDPTSSQALIERGTTFRIERRYEEALADFDAAIAAGGGEAYFFRALTYSERGQYHQAMADFDQAIQRNPDHATAYYNRGMTALVLGEFEQAITDANEALRIDPGMVRAHLLRGMALSKQGRLDEAAEDLDAVLAAEPGNARAHNYRGQAYVAQKDYPAAIASYSEALRLMPEFGAAFYNRACAYHLNGDHEQAIAELTRYLRARDNHAPAYYQRGLAYQAQGEYDRAIADFTKAFQIDPNLIEAYTRCLEATQAKYESARNDTISATDDVILATASQSANTGTRIPRGTGSTIAMAALKTETLGYQIPQTTAENAQLAIPPGSASTSPETDRPTPKPPSGKLQLECPECGHTGLLDMKNLAKRFRCPTCQLWWRLNPAGELEEVEATAESAVPSVVESEKPKPAPLAIREPRIEPPAPPAPEPAEEPETKLAEKERKPAMAKAPVVKPAPGRGRRHQGDRGLRYAAKWLGTAARSRTGIAVFAMCGLVFLFFIPLIFPSLFPSELRSRATDAAVAFVSRDVSRVQSFTDASLAGGVPHWVETSGLPDLSKSTEKPRINVSIERNDGRMAEAVVQFKAANPSGTPVHYVYRHRWISRSGTWYLMPPDVPPVTAAATKPRGVR